MEVAIRRIAARFPKKDLQIARQYKKRRIASKNVFSKKYIEVKTYEELEKFDKNSTNIPYLICEELKGKKLIGLNYEQLWAEAPVPVDSPEPFLQRDDEPFGHRKFRE